MGLGGAADGAWPRRQMGCEWPSPLGLTSQIDAGTKRLRSPSAATPSPSCILAWLPAHTGVTHGCCRHMAALHRHREVHKGLESGKIYISLSRGCLCGCSSAWMCNSKKPSVPAWSSSGTGAGSWGGRGGRGLRTPLCRARCWDPHVHLPSVSERFTYPGVHTAPRPLAHKQNH